MRYGPWDRWRDLTVRLLARLSLVAVLAVLGALFVGGATTSQAASDRAAGSTESTVDRVRPAGLLLGAGVIGGGIVVLLVGACRPPASSAARDLSDLHR